MVDAYVTLHRMGFAHSVEVWESGELVGGVYGVAVDGLFAGESMFNRVNDASKVGLVFLFQRLQQCGFDLFDSQIINDHTAGLGAYEISRAKYLERLEKALRKPAVFA